MVVVRDALLPTYMPACLPLSSFLQRKNRSKMRCGRWVYVVVMFCIEALLACESFSIWYLEFDLGGVRCETLGSPI